MKRVLSVLIASVLCLSMAACGSDLPENTTVARLETAVPETVTATAPAAREQTVEITMDNWQDYFELRTAAEPFPGRDGKPESWNFFYGVFLKREYAEGFVSGQVDFEISFDRETRAARLDPDTGACILGDTVGQILESDFQQKTFAMEDFRDREEVDQRSDFFGAIAGQAYCGSLTESETGDLTAAVPANGQLLHAEGSITFIR